MKKEKISKEEKIKAKYEAKLEKVKEKELKKANKKELKKQAMEIKSQENETSEVTTEKVEKKKINLPNKLTLIRIAFVPLFVVAMALISLNIVSYMKYIALGIFALAAITDFADGYIARKNNLVTRFGKLMDPLADKMLVSAGFIMLSGLGKIPAWITAIIVLRDFAASTVRMFGTEDGETISAGFSGKVKTVFELVGVVLAIIDSNELFAFISKTLTMGFCELLLNVFTSVSVAAAVVFAIWSLVEYIIKYKKHIDIHE